MGGKRRKPWRARVTAGWICVDKDGKEVPDGSDQAADMRQSYYTLGYYATRKEALAALSNFQGVPDKTVPTFGEMYERWLETKELSANTRKSYNTSRSHLDPLADKLVDSLTVDFLDDFFRGLPVKDTTRHKAAALCQQVLKYAYKKGYLASDIAGRMDHYSQPASKIERKVFTPQEVTLLWADPSRCAKAALVALYGGWRPGELYVMTRDMVDLEAMTITAGIKTEAGKDRVVPIHPDILPLVSTLCQEGHALLFRINASSYRKYMDKIGHTPHDTRHTFATVAAEVGMDPVIRKRIMGHAITDITESVYTHATADRFRREIAKIKY